MFIMNPRVLALKIPQQQSKRKLSPHGAWEVFLGSSERGNVCTTVRVELECVCQPAQSYNVYVLFFSSATIFLPKLQSSPCIEMLHWGRHQQLWNAPKGSADKVFVHHIPTNVPSSDMLFVWIPYYLCCSHLYWKGHHCDIYGESIHLSGFSLVLQKKCF